MPDFKIIPPPNDPNEEEIQVGPIEAESAAEVLARLEARDRRARLEAADQEVEELQTPRDNFTFTIKQMLIVVTALGVWLGVLRWLSMLQSSILSGLSGVAALVAMFWISSRDDVPKILRVTWWGMLLIYITCAIATWVTG